MSPQKMYKYPFKLLLLRHEEADSYNHFVKQLSSNPSSRFKMNKMLKMKIKMAEKRDWNTNTQIQSSPAWGKGVLGLKDVHFLIRDGIFSSTILFVLFVLNIFG